MLFVVCWLMLDVLRCCTLPYVVVVRCLLLLGCDCALMCVAVHCLLCVVVLFVVCCFLFAVLPFFVAVCC